MFKEVSCLYANKKILSVTVGSPGGVQFDFFSAWKEWKEKPFKYLLMIHSHPDGCLWMSEIDKNMVAGWAKAFPVPIFFVVVCADNENCPDSIVHIVTNQNKKINITNPMGFEESCLNKFKIGLLDRILNCSYQSKWTDEQIIKDINQWKEPTIFKMEFWARNKNEEGK